MQYIWEKDKKNNPMSRNVAVSTKSNNRYLKNLTIFMAVEM
jgi:hypothetical protein